MASHPTVIRSFSAAPASTAASSTNNSEADIRGAAAVMAAAAVATGAGLISWKSEKADCTAITAVVGKEGFGARCVCREEPSCLLLSNLSRDLLIICFC